MGSGGPFYLRLGEKARLELSLNAARWKLQACTCVHVRGQDTCSASPTCRWLQLRLLGRGIDQNLARRLSRESKHVHMSGRDNDKLQKNGTPPGAGSSQAMCLILYFVEMWLFKSKNQKSSSSSSSFLTANPRLETVQHSGTFSSRAAAPVPPVFIFLSIRPGEIWQSLA